MAKTETQDGTAQRMKCKRQANECFNEFMFMFIYILFSPEDMLTDFREGEGRERERDRNIDVREKHRLVASCTHPNQGLNSRPRHVP